jgi:hypothetical protein
MSQKKMPKAKAGNTGKRDPMAVATLISALIAALASIVAPIILHVMDDRSQATSVQRNIYDSFIAQANSNEGILISSYTTATNIYNPKHSQQALRYFGRLTTPSVSELSSVQEQLSLIAPAPVVKAAASVSAALGNLERGIVTLIRTDAEGLAMQIATLGRSFKQSVDHFIRVAGGIT